MGYTFGISHFIPKKETRHILAPKKCKVSHMVEIKTLTKFYDNVKLLGLQINVIQKARCIIFINSSLNSPFLCTFTIFIHLHHYQIINHMKPIIKLCKIFRLYFSICWTSHNPKLF